MKDIERTNITFLVEIAACDLCSVTGGDDVASELLKRVRSVAENSVTNNCVANKGLTPAGLKCITDFGDEAVAHALKKPAR